MAEKIPQIAEVRRLIRESLHGRGNVYLEYSNGVRRRIINVRRPEHNLGHYQVKSLDTGTWLLVVDGDSIVVA